MRIYYVKAEQTLRYTIAVKVGALTLVTYGRARDARLKTVANALGGIVLGEEQGEKAKQA